MRDHFNFRAVDDRIEMDLVDSAINEEQLTAELQKLNEETIEEVDIDDILEQIELAHPTELSSVVKERLEKEKFENGLFPNEAELKRLSNDLLVSEEEIANFYAKRLIN